MIDKVFQLFAGLEEGDLLGGDVHAVAGLGVAADPGLSLPRAEATEAADLDLVAHAQRTHNTVKDRLYNDFAVLARQLRQPGDFIDQIRFGHVASPLRHGWDGGHPPRTPLALSGTSITFSNFRYFA